MLDRLISTHCKSWAKSSTEDVGAHLHSSVLAIFKTSGFEFELKVEKSFIIKVAFC
jgi:hypothetical protein